MERLPDFLVALLHSRKFWLAVVALAQTLLFQFFPQFPPNVWQAIDIILAILIAAIAGEDMAQKRAQISHEVYAARYLGTSDVDSDE